MTFHIYQDGAGLWRWYLLSDTHRKVAVSAEGYLHRIDCEASIRFVMATKPDTPVFED
jgi:uncharacterized protein YegP (UPF0339 family)